MDVESRESSSISPSESDEPSAIFQAIAWDAPTAFRGYGKALHQLFWATTVLTVAAGIAATPLISKAFRNPIALPLPITFIALAIALFAVFWEIQCKYKCLEFKLPLSFSKLLTMAVYLEVALMFTRWFLRRALPAQISRILSIVLFTLSLILFVLFLSKLAELIGRKSLSWLAKGIAVCSITLLIGGGVILAINANLGIPIKINREVAIGLYLATFATSVTCFMGYMLLLFGMSRSLVSYAEYLQETINSNDGELADSIDD